MNFGDAINLAKQGYCISRKGWNGKNQYVVLGHDFTWTDPRGKVYNANHENIGGSAFVFVGTSGSQVGWLASQADMLATDWIAHDDTKKWIIDKVIPPNMTARAEEPALIN